MNRTGFSYPLEVLTLELIELDEQRLQLVNAIEILRTRNAGDLVEPDAGSAQIIDAELAEIFDSPIEETSAMLECDECGDLFHRNGIGPHRRKHRNEPPIGNVATFDPDQARAAAAAAI